nr:MAG TPA: hypothetical protein [Caudoviricetes sp.]
MYLVCVFVYRVLRKTRNEETAKKQQPISINIMHLKTQSVSSRLGNVSETEKTAIAID